MRNPVNARIPQHFHVISTWEAVLEWAIRGAEKQIPHDETVRNDKPFYWLTPLAHATGSRYSFTTARNDMAFRFGHFASDQNRTDFPARDFLGHAKAEDRKLRKDPSWRSLL
ncbi:MAG TPA: hypothetical protein VGM18_02795 [Candidatus Sulfotelmatobacter sp.]